MFINGESQANSHANGTQHQTQKRRIQQPAINPRRGRFDAEKSLERERRLEIQREQRRREGSNKQRSRKNITQ